MLRDRQKEDIDCGHRGAEGQKHRLRNAERGAQRLERDVWQGERTGMGGVLTCPQPSSRSLASDAAASTASPGLWKR